MKKLKIIIIFIFIIFPIFASATGPYTSTIAKIQTTAIGSPYNTVWLTINVSDSPCSSTNVNNRFTIVNAEQQSTILAALMANKQITIYGTGTCSHDIEAINAVQLAP